MVKNKFLIILCMFSMEEWGGGGVFLQQISA